MSYNEEKFQDFYEKPSEYLMDGTDATRDDDVNDLVANLADNVTVSKAVVVSRAYDRKGYPQNSPVDNTNKSYDSGNTYHVTVVYEVNQWDGEPFEVLNGFSDRVEKAAKEKALAEKRAKLDELDKAQEKLREEADKLLAELGE